MEPPLKEIKDKVIVITGGTGSLGKVLTHRLLADTTNIPKKIIIFSRDEAKQHQMRIKYQQKVKATDELIYHNFERLIEFRIGDVRDVHSLAGVLKEADILIHAAALKQVPTCEYFPYETVQTNILGAENIVRVINQHRFGVQTVVGISTDKACKPVNTMGMTKAIQERIFTVANIYIPSTRFICVRYGNVLASRGSVIPLFHEQIKNGGPVTVTTPEMTRFLLSLEQAVDTIFAALAHGKRGEIYIPKIPSARILDVAKVLIGDPKIEIKMTGIRPGEKIHEMLVSPEEAWHTFDRGDYLAIQPMLPELAAPEVSDSALGAAYCSGDQVLSRSEVADLLRRHQLLDLNVMSESDEFLR